MKIETVKNLKVSLEEFESTYHDKHHVLREYIELMVCARSGMQMGEIAAARSLNRTRDKTGYKRLSSRYDSWVSKSRRPVVVEAILSLHEFGVFRSTAEGSGNVSGLDRLLDGNIGGFDCLNPRMVLSGVLGSYAFWRGGNYRQSTSTGKLLEFRENAQGGIIGRVNMLFGGSGLDNDGSKLRLAGVGARIIALMTGMVGHKGATNQACPRHVQLALNTLECEDASAEERLVAQEIVDHFVLTFFHAGRCTQTESRNYSGFLPYAHSQDVANDRLSFFMSALRLCSFDLSVTSRSYDQMGQADRREMTYSYLCTFNGMTDCRMKRFSQLLSRDVGGVIEEVG